MADAASGQLRATSTSRTVDLDELEDRFEAYWGVTLGSSVKYLRPQAADVTNATAGQFITFNSTSRTWELRRANAGATVDGPTVNVSETRIEQRNIPVRAANLGTSWTDVSAVQGAAPGGTPGSGQAAGAVAQNGCYISELADTFSVDITNESIFEFIEIHCP